MEIVVRPADCEMETLSTKSEFSLLEYRITSLFVWWKYRNMEGKNRLRDYRFVSDGKQAIERR
jgi:hypothetical protein